MEIVGLEKNKVNDIHLRKIRESFWIKKLKTQHPDGLNQKSKIADANVGKNPPETKARPRYLQEKSPTLTLAAK